MTLRIIPGPKKSTAYTFYVSLVSLADGVTFVTAPTIEAGDVTVSKDGGVTVNIAALPTVTPVGGALVRVTVSTTEMGADTTAVLFHDVTGDEWADLTVVLQTAAVTADELARETTAQAILADTGTDGVVLTTPTLANIAAAVWDRLTSALTTAGSVGAHLLAKLGLITSTTNISIGSPVAGTAVTTYQGDDYLAADGRELAWTVSTTATLTGGTVAVIVHGVGVFDGDVASETRIVCTLDRTQTATIPTGKRHYQVIVTQADGDVLTVVDGVWTSRARVSAV